MRYLLFVCLGLLIGQCYAQNQSFSHRVGDREVTVSVIKKPGKLTFVNLHDNENTSVDAAMVVIDSLGGTLIQLQHSGNRNLEFNLNGAKYTADPNRIFTDIGAKATLSALGPFSDAGLKEVRSFANGLVDSLNVDVIYTLHNNGEAGYSAKSYLNEYKTDAADVYMNPTRDEDDFFFVTERSFFDQLKAKGYNVVLQNNETVTDDGSLSVLVGQRGIPYINIEAQHGHLKEQIEMLFVLYSLFD